MQLKTTSPAGDCGGVHARGPGVFERPRYFPRQLMTPDELTLEAEYFRDRMRRHNLYLHGWGVVCGALVCVVPDPGPDHEEGATKPWVVRVQPGYVLGPQGDEIVIDAGCEVSLRGPAAPDTGDCGCGDLGDPWCTEVYADQPPPTRYVAVRYREVQARPVRAQPGGCGCDETPCEYSRYRDGYECGVLDELPTSHVVTPAEPDDGKAVANPPCPARIDSPWVVLARVTVKQDGTIQTIDNCVHRRIVASARDSWITCAGTDADLPRPTAPKPAHKAPAPPPKP